MQNLFCVNIHAEPLDQIDALKFVKKKLTNVNQMKVDEQKKASQAGYDPDILPPQIKMYIDDIEKLLGDLNSKNERLFHISISIRSYAKSKKDLKLQAEMLKRICQKNNCALFPYDYRQEQTLVSTLPLCYNEIPVSREMHTSGIAIFMPFTTKELFQDGQAAYYGVNTLSGNMIRANRSRLKNPNGLILGTPGSGKSFSVKRIILDCFLTTADDIIVCDPEGEYFPLVSALKGQRIRIASNSEQHVNPMDIAIDNYLKKEGEVALRVSNSLEMFVNGSQNLFNHHTNIDMQNRLICFDIKELGNQLKKVGMLIVQDTVWNRVSENRNRKKITRYYIDEFHLLLKEEQTAKYSSEIWKRFRKWGGITTGITQNVKDLLQSKEVENIFDNSDFVYAQSGFG